jgi:fused signal recognition particle receptor
MALRDWITRLRGKEAPPEQPEPPPVTQPGGVPPAPVPPPFTPPDLARRIKGEESPEPIPAEPPAEESPARDDAAALDEALARSEPEPEPEPEPPVGIAPPPPPEPAPAAEPVPPPELTPPPSAESVGIAPPPPPGSPPVPPLAAEPEAEPEQKGGWFARLKAGLARSTAKLTDSITAVFEKRRLDDEALEELEETLIAADLGVAAAGRIVESFRKSRFGKEVTDEEVKAALAEEIAGILAPVAKPMAIEPSRAPHVVLVVGVNGTGKTTTIAKLGQQYRSEGLSCAFVAGDTFRAAAVEQLQIWGDRTGCHVYPPAKHGADAAGLAFDALTDARAKGTQVLLVDTAGRLHNKSALMEELRKIIRVIRRVDETAPHSVLLTLDATTGQNALQQVKVFKEMVAVSGLAVTKLDGSAKGGVVVALAQEFGLPVHMVGVGEKAADLRPFEARDFARSLVGLN